jgi:hypothetical protein
MNRGAYRFAAQGKDNDSMRAHLQRPDTATIVLSATVAVLIGTIVLAVSVF